MHMAYLFILSIIISFLSNNSKINTQKQKYDTLYLVSKIETMNNFYILHLKHKKKYYKVVSNKDSTSKGCEFIKEKQYYSFSLIPILYVEREWEGKKFRIPTNVTGTSFGGTNVYIEENPKYVRELFFIKYLKGLCISY